MNPTIIIAKKLKKLKEKDINHLPSGCGNYYIQLTRKKGIKIARCRFSSMEDLLASAHISAKCKEARILKRVRRVAGNIPRCYGVKIVKIGEMYTVGIILQHLGDRMLLNIDKGAKYRNLVIDDVNRQLSKAGVTHWDLHSKNIMYYKGRFWPIDFEDASIFTPRK